MSVAGKVDDGLDSFAIGASVACLFHCLLLPILFALLPAASAFLGVPESFHVTAFLLAIPASALAMRSGHRRHGTGLPAAFAFVGLVLLGLGAFAGLGFLFEAGTSVLGSILLAFGHVSNWRLRQKAFGANGQTMQCCTVTDLDGDG